MWTTEEDLTNARERFAARIPGYRPPAACGVARRDGDRLTFGHVNPPGVVRGLPAVVLATVAGYVDTTAVVRLDRAAFEKAVELLAPAEGATHKSHPNLWTWRELLDGSTEDSVFLVFLVADVEDPVVDADDAEFRRRW
ncbi:hypothetical protein Val02_40480 [Virgisporangium aliadipatigenens]|uniref:Uncharacterized protein n=1 Tax=Virgisporangium aliadipatigenens TaxID=741659 RepID=A0A8J3YML4_9ACTN|nr:hypothetical protein [Virgisporangium aliadipatigenens]GIJ47162.1 hypothetical protein Val02_40480 [Virgisporangium aliadipatigenens]